MEHMFDAFPGRTPDPTNRRRRTLTLPLSIAAHVVGLGLLVVLPLLTSDLPLPPDLAGSVHAFFIEPVAPPPPPPPPPAAPAPAVHHEPTPAAPQTAAFTAPAETPAEIAPEARDDLGLSGGVEGGVEGGVPGGVVGGVVGGLPAPPPPPLQPVRVGGDIKEPRKLKHVDPVYPRLAQAAHVHGVVVLECILSPNGRVAEVKVVQGIPVLEQAAIDAVKQWVYTPTLYNGVPVAALLTVRVTFAL